MRKSIYLVVAVLTVIATLVGGCGQTANDDFKVGLVTDVGRVNDRSFNQSAWEGVQQVGEELGAEVKYIETTDAKDYADNIAQFVDEGYDVVVTVGYALGDATMAAALANPDIDFIGVDQTITDGPDNYVGLIFNEDQAGYLAGVVAASLSTTGTIAGVFGTDLIPAVYKFKEGYEAGALSVNPDINIISTYHPGEISQAFTDPEWGAATAAQAVDQGADVVFAAGGMTGNGALEEVATHPGLYCIGVDSDQWETVEGAQPCLVCSAMKMITPGVVDLVTAAKEGNMPSGNYVGEAGLSSFHDFDSQISDELKATLEEISTGFANGTLTTGVE